MARVLDNIERTELKLLCNKRRPTDWSAHVFVQMVW